MAENVLHFALKTIGRSTREGRKPCDLLSAARHNLREIQAELGARGHIDPRRMTDNVTLAGPATAAQVQALANELLALVDTTKLKRDHVQAVEVVFSLPPGTPIEPLAYFSKCVEWLRVAVPLPVLLAVVHMDEAAPHTHVLLLPVKDGKHVGGRLIDLEAAKRLRESFFQKVAGPAGLKRSGAKVRGQVKQWAIAAVLARCDVMGLPAAMGPLWEGYRRAIEHEPTPQMLALGIDVNTIRPVDEKAIALHATAIALPSKAIALQNEGGKTEEQSCVALLPPATPASAPKAASGAAAEPAMPPQAIDSLAALWAAVGCRSNWTTPTKADRLSRAREAQQRAIDRHRPKAAAQVGAGATHHHGHQTTRVTDGDLTRERDQHVHDTTAWND